MIWFSSRINAKCRGYFKKSKNIVTESLSYQVEKKNEDDIDAPGIDFLLGFFCVIGWIGLPLILIYVLLDTQIWVFIVGMCLVTLSLIPNLFTFIMTLMGKG